ncbi:gluconeogenesis factor YvcK family protein [Thalassotalea agarivorans]|uniref:Putative gluconeogenesis factor n=1 Tax=Thalassotalea agarivorans TaxID=349064 RepID=A0A1I0DK52_THASX|nr:uridine diphosphate-N-acetylglucosamine-binding protein YvcK [Thalassotalea agarivorans]SET32824.1 conserved hypothetical protein, cofD-related [Thalassotalea agarivorans]
MKLKELNAVAIGGGHGLGRVLSTLSFMGDRLTGIVTTTDNGGSTGRLRKRSSSIAWGDLRNCLTQLVDEQSIANQLFNFRFQGQDELSGHNLGNLILYGLERIQSSPIESIEIVRRLLRVKTRVLPMSETPTDLMAFYPTGRCRVGELSVDDMPIMPENLMLAPLVKAPSMCVEAIANADIVILGPGSFLTSIIPPLLVRDIAQAIAQSDAICIFIDNLVPEHSPAAMMSLDDKIDWIEKNAGHQIVDCLITQEPNAKSSKVDVFSFDLSADDIPHRHDEAKLTTAIQEVISLITKEKTSAVAMNE